MTDSEIQHMRWLPWLLDLTLRSSGSVPQHLSHRGLGWILAVGSKQESWVLEENLTGFV